ncbi:Golgi apparatus membrane protein TVP38 [Serendipita indica DSM 11827]|nr:Golgi apparatus membrane protein TVP38 [Serendipita indica DSM 11827]
MNRGQTHFYPSQNTQATHSQQSFKPYNSYNSSTTLYEPNYGASNKQSTVGYANEYHGSQSQDNFQNQYTAEPKAGAGNGEYKGAYASGGYAQGPPRSPSPTPSELEATKRGVIDWKKLFNWRTYAHKKYIPWALGLIVILVVVALMTLYHKQIVHWLTPAANWMHNFKYGWIIPIVVLFVISFPPLFGHEIVAVLCGVVWGIGVGFAIVAVGTLLGEIGNFYAFKYCCASRGEKLERQKLSYACLARVVREGGFKIALIARLSAIPGHFTTAVFSTCGMGIVVFTIAAILSLPKQFITVYLGVLLEQSNDTPEQQAKNKTSRIISDVALAVTFLVTVAAMWYIWREMNRVQPAVFKERRQAKKKALAPSMETQYLARSSNVDVNSVDEEMQPVRNNEQRMGSFGYGGYGQNAISTDAVHNAGKFSSYEYPPAPYQDPYNQSGGRQPVSYDVTGAYRPIRLPSQPPQLDEPSNLTGPRRNGRGWETSGDSTVGMGSWGGLKQPSESDPTGRQYEPDANATTQASNFSQPEQFAPQRRGGADEYGMLHAQTGLSALGAPMGGGDTISVVARNAPGARQSVQQTGHIGGRSMRAVVEDHDSDLGYMQASPPSSSHPHLGYYDPTSHFSEPSSSAYTSQVGHSQAPSAGQIYHPPGRSREASSGTFGVPRSLHSREHASSGASEARDEPFIPPDRR